MHARAGMVGGTISPPLLFLYILSPFFFFFQLREDKADPNTEHIKKKKQVCHGIDRSVVNWDLVTMDPSTVEEKTNNAKYAISVARKLGACVFVAAEDIVEVCWSYSRLRVALRVSMLQCASSCVCRTSMCRTEWYVFCMFLFARL